MKRLIVNADDLGITRGVNRGIVESHVKGIVTSATLMANGEAFADAVALARRNPQLGVGVHIVLTGGRAVASRDKVGGLADAHGWLPKSLAVLLGKWHRGQIRRRAVENEMRAQIECVLEAGIKPTHLDTHKHAHCHPGIMSALARVAGEFGISRVRMPFEDARSVFASGDGSARPRMTRRLFVVASRAGVPMFRRVLRKSHLRAPEHFFGFALTGRLGRESILQILRNLPEGTSELVCHPGISDADLEKLPTRLKAERERELAALTDPLVRKAILAEGVRLINYWELN